jgi:hypothetical protein
MENLIRNSIEAVSTHNQIYESNRASYSVFKNCDCFYKLRSSKQDLEVRSPKV